MGRVFEGMALSAAVRGEKEAKPEREREGHRESETVGSGCKDR